MTREEILSRLPDLQGANLQGAYLRDANLRDANLRGADLQDADLRDANLRDANLRHANLQDAYLRDAEGAPAIVAARLRIIPDGTLIGWKKCRGGVIVKLRIPEEARRSNATGRKCRAEFADVLEVIGDDVGASFHDYRTLYAAGARVTADEWCEDRWQECAGGIHFFLTREEAEAYPY